ncbi:hypothetical protein P43SY_007366 [Pythium insidiosum]|uniref:Palmitoyltransferase n=1 Tax=Pythium insidiosum TaxID=114742 RepID=A0AAD5Q7W0_PYTIN|nr:hypothetical protein P43SY_007366 [Pythium insidiosum]
MATRGLFAAIAMALMALKAATWLWIVRLYASGAMSALYVATTALMLWSYTLAVTTDPGHASDSVWTKVSPAALEASVSRTQMVDEDDEDDHAGKGWRYCERCDAPKPLHVHHCSACGRCVYRMDHHCPWTNNCVGWANKKYFFLFLVYTASSCLVFNAMETPLVWSTATRAAVAQSKADLAAVANALLLLAWPLSLGIGLMLVGYASYHVWLLSNGKTTLEYLTNKTGEFEGWPLALHARVYMGSNTMWWWLPVPPELEPRLRGGAKPCRESQTFL